MAEPRKVLFLCSGNYYRSRFAEELFNHLATALRLPYRADSAGLQPACHTRNPGPMSQLTISALIERGVPLPAVLRAPRDVQASEFLAAERVIALKAAEHRPLLESRFPEYCAEVEFWHVDDVGDAPPSLALPLIEQHVRELVSRLAAQTVPSRSD